MQHYCPTVGIAHKYCAIAETDGFPGVQSVPTCKYSQYDQRKKNPWNQHIFPANCIFVLTLGGTIALYGDFISALLLTYFKNIMES